MTAGWLRIVGIGPGDADLVAPRALHTLKSAEIIIGFEGYIELARAWLPDGCFRPSAITHEIERARDAVEQAHLGRRVALIGSGDAGVYGLAGLAFEIAADADVDLQIEVVPGITAATAAAALLGAPLGHDFAVVSLSDLLTPWELIRERLQAAAAADFVTVLYNPASKRRRRQLAEALQIFREHRTGQTPVGCVTQAFRAGQRIEISTLDTFNPASAGMLTTLVIGSSTTRRWRNALITPRGYQR